MSWNTVTFFLPAIYYSICSMQVALLGEQKACWLGQELHTDLGTFIIFLFFLIPLRVAVNLQTPAQ